MLRLSCWPRPLALSSAKPTLVAAFCRCSSARAQRFAVRPSAVQASPLRAAHCRPHSTNESVMSASPEAASMSVAQSSSGLWQRVQAVYAAALASGALFKTDSTDEFMEDGGIEFVVRVAASLREKAKKKTKQTEADPKAWRDPFEPHEEALFVQDLGPDHKLLLNKFNVVAHHCLVVTKDFQHQTDALTAGDLGAAWQVLQAMPDGGVCYFNCGSASGASQPHKHLQIVPLPFAVGRPSMPIAHVLGQACGHSTSADCTEVRSLPYHCFACKLPSREQVSAAQLLKISNAVFDAMKASIGGNEETSYNVLLTAGFLVYVPRSQESSGPADVNALGFAGTLFVRSEEEVEHLRQRSILQLLTDVGLPWQMKASQYQT